MTGGLFSANLEIVFQGFGEAGNVVYLVCQLNGVRYGGGSHRWFGFLVWFVMGWLANDYSQFIAVLDWIRKVYWFFIDQNSEAYPALGGWWLEAYCQQGIANGGSSPQ